jgi:hypothetical protein
MKTEKDSELPEKLKIFNFWLLVYFSIRGGSRNATAKNNTAIIIVITSM